MPVLASAAALVYVAAARPGDLRAYAAVASSVGAIAYGLALVPRRLSDRTFLLVTVVAVQATLLSLRHVLQLSPDIGDSRWVVEFAATNTVFPRWLGASYLTSSSLAFLSSLTFTREVFASAFPTPEGFVRFFLGAVILAQSAHLLITTRHLGPIAFVVLSPFGLLFLGGHIEIYMIVALFVVQCCETIRRIETGPMVAGALIGVLGVLYSGAWHLCLGLLVVAFLRRPHALVVLLASAAVTFLVGTDMLWPGDLRSFAERFNSSTPTGLRLLVPEYHLRAGAGLFWKPGFLFSEAHLRIVGQILFVGFAPFALVVSQSAVLSPTRFRVRPLRSAQLGWILLGLLALAFVLLMIPRLGIDRDIDLYAVSCVSMLYLASSFLQPALDRSHLRRSIATYVLYSVLTFGLLL